MPMACHDLVCSGLALRDCLSHVGVTAPFHPALVQSFPPCVLSLIHRLQSPLKYSSEAGIGNIAKGRGVLTWIWTSVTWGIMSSSALDIAVLFETAEEKKTFALNLHGATGA